MQPHFMAVHDFFYVEGACNHVRSTYLVISDWGEIFPRQFLQDPLVSPQVCAAPYDHDGLGRAVLSNLRIPLKVNYFYVKQRLQSV